MLVKDPRLGAAWRSMVFPGWGQRYKDEKRKGLVFSGLWLTAVGGTLISHFAYRDAKNRYEAAADPTEIEKHYGSADNWFKARNNLAVASIGVYLCSYLDALLTKVPETFGAGKALGVTPTIRPNSPQYSPFPMPDESVLRGPL
jgi:hypothetical protein